MRSVSESHAGRQRLASHVDVEVDAEVRVAKVRLRAERAEVPLNGGDAGILWAEYSPFPGEAGIAGRRYKQLAPLYTDPWALLMAVCEAAFEGHHAAGSCRGDYLRSRAGRIRETVYYEQKARDDAEERQDARRFRGLKRLNFTDPLALFGRSA